MAVEAAVRKSHYSMQNRVLLAMLKACRQEKGLRQADVAGLVGCDQTTVSRIESGERRLDILELRELLLAIEVGFVDFVVELDDRVRVSARATLFPQALPGKGPGGRRTRRALKR